MTADPSVAPLMVLGPPRLDYIAQDLARDLAALDLAGQLGVALKLVLIVAHRLPVDLQAETAGEIIVALARDLPRGTRCERCYGANTKRRPPSGAPEPPHGMGE